MGYALTIEIKGLPQMANGPQGKSWKRGHFQRQLWKRKVANELCGNAPAQPFRKIRATFTRCSSVEPDDDGLAHGFKPLRDALVKFGFVVDDKRENMEAHYKWELAPARCGKVRIEIEPLDTLP